jgi:hypothetical protein
LLIHCIRHTDQPIDTADTKKEGITPSPDQAVCLAKIHKRIRPKPTDVSTEPQQANRVAEPQRIFEVAVHQAGAFQH